MLISGQAPSGPQYNELAKGNGAKYDVIHQNTSLKGNQQKHTQANYTGLAV